MLLLHTKTYLFRLNSRKCEFKLQADAWCGDRLCPLPYKNLYMYVYTFCIDQLFSCYNHTFHHT